jgi:outer membrane protein TolC
MRHAEVAALLDPGEGVAQLPSPPELPSTGAPADLLRNRPDLRAAEQRLRAAVARVGVEEAGLYPSFTLSGSLGWTAADLADLGPTDSLRTSFGPSVTWAFLDIPEVRRRMEAADARSRQSLHAYQAALRRAISETEIALSDWRLRGERLHSVRRQVEHQQSALEASRQLYAGGAVSLLDLLDAERQLLEARTALISTTADHAASYIDACRALGGSWRTPGNDTPAQDRKG